MRLVLGIATVLGIVGPIAAFGLFFLGDRVFHLDHPHLQPMMYLMLSVAGHLTIFQTRTRGPFWSIRPAKVLLFAVLGTQILATFIAVYGFLMPPLGWGWAGFVWGYALLWFFITDPVKLLAYKILDRTKTEGKPEAKAGAKPDATAQPAPEAKAKPSPGPKPQTPTDLTPQLVQRVHELYEALGREEVRVVEDLEKTQRELPQHKPEPEPEPHK